MSSEIPQANRPSPLQPERPYGFAPPIDVGEVPRPPTNSSWPTVIGTIAIILGSLAGLGGLSGVVFQLAFPAIKSAVPRELAKQWETMEVGSGWAALWSAVYAVLALLLLVAGVGLVKRRLWAIRPALVWAVLKMVYAVGMTVYQYVKLPQQMEVVSQAAPAAGALPTQFVQTMVLVGLLGSLLWYCALPVFLLIWFGRRKIKDEVQAWS